MDAIFWNSIDPNTWNFLTRYIGPYKLSYWIDKHGYTSQVIDFIVYMTEDQLYNVTKKFITPDTVVLGMSTTFITSTKGYKWSNGTVSSLPEHVIRVAERIKKEFPKIKIVLGGYGSDHTYMYGIPHATIMSYTTATEDIFLEYLDSHRKGTPLPLGKLQTTFAGVAQGSGEKYRMHYDTARNPKYNIEDDDFKWRDRDLIFENESLPLDISRGCIFACRFCQYPHLGKNKLDYVRKMEHVKNEMLSNYEKFKITSYMVLDDTFNDTPEKMKMFNDMVSTLPFKIKYSAYIRADLIHRFPETAYMLKDSGLIGSFNGIESLHPYASKLVGKAWSGKHAKDYIPELYHNIWKGDVPILLSFIVGLPKETKEDLYSTIDWLRQSDLHSAAFHTLGIFVQNSSARYTIMSEFDKNYKKYGFDFDNNNQWYNETWTQDSAYRFTSELHNILVNERLNKMGSWNIGNMLFLGYDMDYIKKTHIKDIDYNFIKKSAKSLVDVYYTKLMAI